MELQTIIENTPGILAEAAVFTALVYPIYTGLKSVVSKERFVELSTKAETLYTVAGFGIGKILLDYGYLLSK